MRDQHALLLESGRVLTLKVGARDLDKAKTIIDARWLALQITALSGAAEAVEELNKDPPPPALITETILLPPPAPRRDAETEADRGMKLSVAEEPED